MKHGWSPWTQWLAVAVILSAVQMACAPPSPARTDAGAAPPQRTTPKLITLAIIANPQQFISKWESLAPGATDLEVMVASGTAIPDEVGVLRPLLADAVPSLENGRWVLHPDGRMETTWKLRPNVRWHDGTPFTADDLLFTGRLAQDPELPYFRHPGFAFVERIEAPDAQTAVVFWRQPYVSADTLFTPTIDNSRITIPLPRHLLEDAYVVNKQMLRELPYWSDQFVGTGPFRLRTWEQGSHVILEAFDGYALGRPRVDQIEVRFIPDGNTLVANVLAGTIDASLGRQLSLDQTIAAEKQWGGGGRMVFGAPGTWFAIWPQFLNPDPAIIADARFRKALMHATDRKEMAETLMYGLVPVADIMMSPVAPEYSQIEPSIVRYDYNPGRASELLRGLGFVAAPDGMLRDATGRQLTVDLMTDPADLWVKAAEAVSTQWRSVGVQVRTEVVPPSRAGALEYRATRPGFVFSRRGTGMENLLLFQTKELPLPENRFAGKNLSRYSNPEMDTLVDRYFAAVIPAERTQVLAQVMHHMSDQLPIMTLFYDTEPSLVSNRIVNYGGKPGPSTGAWNVDLWDVREP